MNTPSPEQTSTESSPDLSGPLLRFRVAAVVTGIALLGLTLAFILKYAADEPGLMRWVGVSHGVLYMFYLAIAIDLALKARWSMKGTVLVLLAGVVPFASFVAERVVTQRVRDGGRI